MKSRLALRSKAVSAHIQQHGLVGPVFPRPSRRLLEGLGWIPPVNRAQALCCFHTEHAKFQKPSRAPKISHVQSEPLKDLDDALRESQQLLQTLEPPDQNQILRALRKCEKVAQHFKEQVNHNTVRKGQSEDLLFLDDGGRAPDQSKLAAAIQATAVHKLSEAAWAVYQDPKVFITPEILKSYVNVQTNLGRPETFAEAFKLYAEKPVPIEGSKPVQYKAASPNRPAAAVPLETVETALEAAIEAQVLPLCLDIIQNSVCTQSFLRNKIISRALVPVSAAAAAPIGAWTIASQFAVFQATMSSQTATTIAFAGTLSYVVFTGAIGYIALATSNDQMDRVTWADGTPLRFRWLREEERGMLDKVSQAWGFREDARRGEETGEEWEGLKELIGLRGMVLDRVELMEGME